MAPCNVHYLLLLFVPEAPLLSQHLKQKKVAMETAVIMIMKEYSVIYKEVPFIKMSDDESIQQVSAFN